MRTSLSWLVLTVVGAVAWLPAGRLPAQVRFAREAVVDADLGDILGVGSQLEQQQRWGEALTHYEDALRKHPGTPNLVQRHFLARLHYDVARRYADSSFVAAVSQLNIQQTLDLYGEILLKIQTYYVDSPDWRSLVARGLTALDVAFHEDAFRKRHGLSWTEGQYQTVMTELRQQLGTRQIKSRREAQEAVLRIAFVAEQQLGVPARVAVFEFACAAGSSLDDYSAFLTGNQLDEVLSQIEGNFVGLGIELKADADSLLIVNVIPSGPADRAGIRPGDRIVRVDGHSTKEVSTDLAADMLRGEEGSRVELVVRDPTDQARPLSIVRMRVDVPSIERAEIVDAHRGIAYLQLTSFQKQTAREVEAALWDLHRQGMRSLIVDVRGNPGGLLNAAVEVADKFIADGGIVSTRGRSSGEARDYRAHLHGTWRVPLVVLIDGDSASASEIFAGAVRDHRRGVIVGQRSFGKGSVQGIFPVTTANMGVRLTTAKFYSPNGQPISRHGVEPDLPVRTAARPAADGSQVNGDPVLQAGMDVARQRFGQRS